MFNFKILKYFILVFEKKEIKIKHFNVLKLNIFFSSYSKIHVAIKFYVYWSVRTTNDDKNKKKLRSKHKNSRSRRKWENLSRREKSWKISIFINTPRLLLTAIESCGFIHYTAAHMQVHIIYVMITTINSRKFASGVISLKTPPSFQSRKEFNLSFFFLNEISFFLIFA